MAFDKSTGYNYLYKPNHPNAKQNGMIAEHRYVMSKKLGRPLKLTEHCHHKDENKLNNDVSNLMIVSWLEHHYIHHAKPVEIVCEVCEQTTTNKQYCSHKCRAFTQRRAIRPSKKELLLLLKKNNFCKVGRMYGVSDNAIRKWL